MENDSKRMKLTRTPKTLEELEDSKSIYGRGRQYKLSADEETKNKNFPYTMVQLGTREIDIWFSSAYELLDGIFTVLFICEQCLQDFRMEEDFYTHITDCTARLPGKLMYKKDSISIREVDGNKNRNYCTNLCRLGKLFTEYKEIMEKIESLYFYVLFLERDEETSLIGYFSKVKVTPRSYNLLNLVILPIYQREGYGTLLIEFSYELCKLESIAGGPKEPMTECGLKCYHAYWTWLILHLLADHRGSILIKELSEITGMIESDIKYTLNIIGKTSFWKGELMVKISPALIKKYLDSGAFKKPKFSVDANAIQWTHQTTAV